MTMDPETRALVEQLVAALAPLNHPAPSHALQETPDHEPVHGGSYTAGAARAATAAIVAGKAALAARAS